MEKKNLGVIYGSKSCEHDVSIISAVQLMNAADTEKYNIVPIYIARNGQWYTGENLKKMTCYTAFDKSVEALLPVSLDLSPKGELVSYQPVKGLFANSGLKRQVVARIDCAVIVMHGMNGEDGTLQGLLEIANIPYTSTGVSGSAIGMDKIMMKQFFKGANLPVLESTWLSRSAYEKAPDESMAKVEKALSYPVFVKPANLGSSIGVSKAEGREELAEALEVAFSFDRRVLIERGLKSPMELNCAVLGYDGECEASVLEMPNTGGEFLSFFEKYMSKSGASEGMVSLKRMIPAPIPDELSEKIKQMSKDIFAMLDCKGVVRIDYMKEADSDAFYITEINTIPGSLAFYLWEHEGLKYAELIDRMVSCAFKAHEDKNKYDYAYTSDILSSFGEGVKGGGTKLDGSKM